MSINESEDNQLNGFDDGFESGLPEMPPPNDPAPTNRTFLIAAGVIAGLFIIGLLVFGGYLLLGRNTAAERAVRAAAIEATNEAIAFAATETAVAVSQAEEAKAAPLQTQAPTNTPVIVVATNTPRPTNTTSPDAAGQTATASAQLTLTPLVPSPTALPTTGFADEVGLPGLFGLGLFLLVVVFFTRRMRLSNQ